MDHGLSPQVVPSCGKSAPERLVLGSSSCTFYVAPDYRTVTEIDVRRAIGYAYPYKAANLAAGSIEGVTVIDPDLTLKGLAILHAEVAGGTPLELPLA